MRKNSALAAIFPFLLQGEVNSPMSREPLPYSMPYAPFSPFGASYQSNDIYFGSPIFIPAKHPVMSYATQNREARKRHNKRKFSRR